MSSKTSAEVVIGGKVYTLSGYEEEDYLQRVATYINNKIGEFQAIENYHRLSGDMQATLLELNIADDYFKVKGQAEKYQKEVEQREKEIYDLKHELISKQIKMEADEKAYKDLENENKELLLNKARMETALEQSSSVLKESEM